MHEICGHVNLIQQVLQYIVDRHSFTGEKEAEDVDRGHG